MTQRAVAFIIDNFIFLTSLYGRTVINLSITQDNIFKWEVLKGLFGLSREGRRVEESKVELTVNRLILGQLYSILLYSL